MDLPSFPILLSFFLFLFILVKKGYKTQNQNSKLPPGPWKLPFIGSLHHLLGGLPHHSLRNLAKKHGPLMHLQLGEVSAIVVTSPKMATEVMKTHDLKFSDRPVVTALERMTYGTKGLIFAPYGDYWRQMRKICVLELLTAKRVQSFQSIREKEVWNLIQSISSTDGSPVNLSERIYSLTNDVIARAAFGKTCKDKQSFLSTLQEAIQLAGWFDVAELFPSLNILHVICGKNPKLERIHREFDKILVDIMKEHKENMQSYQPKKVEHEEDLVDVLLRVQEDANLEFPITDDDIKAVILDIFAGGYETSTAVIIWAMSEMLKNPTVLEKAQKEARSVLDGRITIKETVIHELKYLKFVIKETLRLHSPGPLLLRECKERCVIDGYDIPVKTKVIINAWAIGRDPKHWNDAEKFIPERFDGISIDFKGANFEYIPFGAGRRICPGILLGLANIELALAQLLYHFDWKIPNVVKPEELDMTEIIGLTVRRKNDLYLIATRYQ